MSIFGRDKDDNDKADELVELAQEHKVQLNKANATLSRVEALLLYEQAEAIVPPRVRKPRVKK